MTRVFWIYGLRDPRDGLFHYVGCTVQALAQRLAAHVNLVRLAVRGEKDKWLRDLRDSGFSPEIVPLIAATDASAASALEVAYTDAFRSLGLPITNKPARLYAAGRFGAFREPRFPSEGLRAIRAIVRTPGFRRVELSNAAHVGDVAVTSWVNGKSRPGYRARIGLEAHFGIPVDAWDREVVS